MKNALLLFAFALALRVAVAVVWRFDGLYGQDAYAYYDQAVAIARSFPLIRPPADFFWPNGYPLLAALLMLGVGQTALAAQLASLLCGAALSPLAYGLSVALFRDQGQRAGVVAGLILAVAGQPILSSVSAMSDMPALFWTMLALWLVVRGQGLGARGQGPGEGERQRVHSRQDAIRDMQYATRITFHASLDTPPSAFRLLPSALLALAAGLCLGLAAITRWLTLLLVPACVLYIITRAKGWREAARDLVAMALGGAVAVVPQFWLSLNRPDSLLHHWLLGWAPANFLRRQFETLDGVATYRVPVAVYNLEPLAHPAFLFPLLGLAALWGTWRLALRHAWPALIVLLGWWGPFYLFLAGIPYENFRYGLILYPPLALLAGYGVADLWDTRWRGLVKAGLAVSLAGMLMWAVPMLNSFITTQNGSKALAAKVAEAVPADATLVALGLTATLRHSTELRVIEIFNETPDTLRTTVCGQPRVYALLDVANVEGQWAGRSPQTAYHWLRDGPGVQPVGQFGPYTLFKVGQTCG